MKEPKKTVLYWAPRVITILFAAFISIFAADVFGEYTFPEVVWALLIHLIPTFIVVIVLIIAWRWEWVGAILCVGLAVFYIFGSNFDLDWIVMLLIPGPLLVLAVLWLLGWRQKKKFDAHLMAE